jgi:hypothetical protein
VAETLKVAKKFFSDVGISNLVKKIQVNLGVPTKVMVNSLEPQPVFSTLQDGFPDPHAAACNHSM